MPSFLGRHIAVCSHWLRCGGDPFACLRGVLSPRGPLFCFVWWLVRCGLDLGCALPTVRCPWSCVLLSLVRGPSLAVIALCRCFCLRGYGHLSVVVVPLFVGGWASFFLSFVWLLLAPLPCRLMLPFPCGWSLVASWSSFFAGPSLWVSGCFCDGLVALPSCWGCCCALSPSLHFVSWQQRPLALCGVCFPLHHDACVVRVLSITTLRYHL